MDEKEQLRRRLALAESTLQDIRETWMDPRIEREPMTEEAWQVRRAIASTCSDAENQAKKKIEALRFQLDRCASAGADALTEAHAKIAQLQIECDEAHANLDSMCRERDDERIGRLHNLDELETIREEMRHQHEARVKLMHERDEARADLDSMCRELSVICGGPGTPREGESRVAYWLRRVVITITTSPAEQLRRHIFGLTTGPEWIALDWMIEVAIGNLEGSQNEHDRDKAARLRTRWEAYRAVVTAALAFAEEGL